MSACRHPIGFLLALVLLMLVGQHLQAEEVKNPVVDWLKNIWPEKASDQKIDESQQMWAYGAGVVGFIIVFGIAWFLVRLVAFVVVVGSFLGGILLVCEAVYSHRIRSWEQLAALVVAVGLAAGISAVTANIYLIKGGMAGEEKKA